jgi:hypothetical protein
MQRVRSRQSESAEARGVSLRDGMHDYQDLNKNQLLNDLMDWLVEEGLEDHAPSLSEYLDMLWED